jgi:farnesyl diphosphate synthase
MFDLQQALAELSHQVDEAMEELLPSSSIAGTKVISISSGLESDETPQEAKSGENKIMEAMRYSSFGGGKRLRPFLTVECAGLFGVSPGAAMTTAAAIEFIHTYSLIHDDLPAMDDDEYRRGKPSCHVQFGEAAAILAGDALLTYAFEVLANSRVHADASVRCELIRIIAKAAGVRGMVGGQMMDLDAEKQQMDADELFACSG